jgi:hypothetical protein
MKASLGTRRRIMTLIFRMFILLIDIIMFLMHFSETKSSRDREVSSYDFDANRSASPELGIPDVSIIILR